MDAIELLKQDHERVKDLLQQFKDADDGARKREVARQVLRELIVHEEIEEQIFYPAYKNAADEEGRKQVAESKEEHHVVDLLIDELQELDPSSDAFEAKFKVMTENIGHHIEEEEEEMFPSARKLLKDQLDDLGKDMQELKDNLLKQAKQKRSETA